MTLVQVGSANYDIVQCPVCGSIIRAPKLDLKAWSLTLVSPTLLSVDNQENREDILTRWVIFQKMYAMQKLGATSFIKVDFHDGIKDFLNRTVRRKVYTIVLNHQNRHAPLRLMETLKLILTRAPTTFWGEWQTLHRTSLTTSLDHTSISGLGSASIYWQLI